jgi:hypothetical protein
VCLAGALTSYWLVNRPLNARVAAWTPSTLPADWADYRSTWERAHAVTAGLSGIATVVLLIATVWAPESLGSHRTDPTDKET